MKTLFVSMGSYGLIAPSFGAAAELHRRGHTSRFLAPNRAHTLIHSAGQDPLDIGDSDDGQLTTDGWWTPDTIVPQHRKTRDAIQAWGPDAVVVDQFSIGALSAARAEGLPVAVWGGAAFILPTPDMRGIDDSESRIRNRRYEAMVRGYNSAAARLGFALTANVMLEDSPFLGDRFLLRSVPAFEVLTPRLPQRVAFVGACLHEQATATEELERWLTDSSTTGRPVAFVQVEKLFDFRDFIPDVLTLLESHGVRTVAALGRYAGRYHRRDSDVFVTDYVPQALTLQSAKFVISTGHTTSVLGGIMAGLPELVIDFGSGAPEVAECLRRSGVGIHIPGVAATRPALSPLIERLVTDDLLAHNAQRLRRAFLSVSSFAEVARIIEELAGRKSQTAMPLALQ